jgi:hypothetical protein
VYSTRSISRAEYASRWKEKEDDEDDEEEEPVDKMHKQPTGAVLGPILLFSLAKMHS